VTVVEYLEAVKERLITEPVVISFEILRERKTVMDAHLRVRLELVDSSQLEFSEYVQHSPPEQIEVITYSYHWAKGDYTLIRRWDNAPHYPDLPGFPHHIHDGATGSVLPGHPMSIFTVLDEIASQIALA
jgi:hypothetical protein